jgi:hypothetical protein
MIVTIILAMTTTLYGAEALLLTEVTKIRLLDIKGGKAVVQGLGGSTAEVEVGDSVGRERGKVVEMGKSYIIVETETSRIKMPLGVQLEH